MDLTLFEKILGFTGIGFSMFVAVLALFWKADDALGEEIKADISLHLMCLDVRKYRPNSLDAISSIFTNMFGKKHFSIRCFIVSSLCSILITSIFSAIVFLQNDFSLWRNLNIINVTILFLTFNTIVDYISLLQTRHILELARYKKRKFPLILLDFILTSMIVVISIFVVVNIYQFRTTPDFSIKDAFIDALTYTRSLIDNFFGTEFIPTRKYQAVIFETKREAAITSPPILSTYFTSIWIWIYTLGYSLIRAFNELGWFFKGINYVLPVETKPMRSIGIVVAPITGLLFWCSTMF